MKEIGLTPRETAIILTVAIAGSGVARTVFGALADAFNKHALLMAVCCVAAAVAHVCLYFTPPINRNGAPSVTHEVAARVLCSDDRMAICVMHDPGNNDVWNGSKVEGNTTGRRQEVRGQGETRGSCSMHCCSVVDPSSRSGYQTLTSEQAIRDPASIRTDGQAAETAVWRISEDDPASSSAASSEPPVMSESAIANLSRNCANFTNLTIGDSNWTAAFDAEVKDCASVWIFDLPANLTDDDARTCGSAEWTYSLCTLQCHGFDPYSNASEKDRYDTGQESQYGITFVFFFIFFFFVLFFICPIFSIADSLVYAVLGEKGKDFGQVRLWGTFSLGLFAVLSGLAMDALAKSGVSNVYVYPFIVCISLLLVTAVLSYSIPAAKPKPPNPATPTLPRSDASLQGNHIPGLPSYPCLSNGRSSSLVTLGSHLGQLGVVSFQSANVFDVGGSAAHESQNPGDIRGSFALIPQGDLGKFVAAKSPGDSGTFVTVVPQNSKDFGEFVAPIREDFGDSVHLKTQNPEDSVPTKSPKSGDSEESVPLKPLNPGPPTPSMSRNFVLLLSNPIIVIVFVTVLVAGLILGQHNAFFFWYLKTLGASQLLLGLNIVVSCATEVALLFTSGRIIQVVGYRCCLYLLFAVYGIRLLVNSFIRNPWMALGTEMTQSLCNGLLFPAASLCINDLAPAGMHGTVQGIIGALHWSVG